MSNAVNIYTNYQSYLNLVSFGDSISAMMWLFIITMGIVILGGIFVRNWQEAKLKAYKVRLDAEFKEKFMMNKH